jgi:hypothetical protein
MQFLEQSLELVSVIKEARRKISLSLKQARLKVSKQFMHKKY